MVLVIVAAHISIFYAPNTWIKRDGRFYTNMNVTVVEDFGIEQSRFASSWYNGNLGWNRHLPASFSNIAVGRNGEHWPMHPWLMPILSTPLFFSFGIIGTLLFNLIMFGVIALTAYRFTREYVEPAPAAMAIGILLLGTSVREHAYDYNVDILLLALFTSALAALVARRGLPMGVLLGMVLVLKPTSLLLFPAVLVMLWERRDLQTLKHSLWGGAAVLLVAAGVNTYLFGRPWWFGYHRVLTVENGVMKIVSDMDAFSTPLVQGAKRMWSGAWGLSHRQTLMALALPGLAAMLIRRWPYAFAALGTATLAFFVFSKFHYEGDRFLWPVMALLLPALGMTFDLLRRGVRASLGRIRRINLDGHTATAVTIAVLGVVSVVARMPFAGAGSGTGQVLLQLTAIAVAVFSATRILLRVAPPVLAVATAALVLLPLLRDVVVPAGPVVIAAALGLLSLDLALHRRWALAGTLGAACAWAASAPWLAGLAVLVLAAAEGRPALKRAGPAVLAVLAAWGLVHLAKHLLGSPPGPVPLETAGSFSALAHALVRGPGRFVLVLLIAAPFGLAITARQDWRVAAALAIVAASALLPGVLSAHSNGLRSPLLLLTLTIPLASLCAWLGQLIKTAVENSSKKRLWLCASGLLAVLLATGTLRAMATAQEPFRLGSQKGMRRAEVWLGRIPCDFIPWEHMSWECSHLDRGHFNQVGLALPEGVRVGGQRADMLLIPTGLRGQPRSVIWKDLEAREVLNLRYASPDRPRGNVEVTVSINGEEVDRFKTEDEPNRRIRRRRIDTSSFAGTDVELRLRVRSLGRPGAAVAIDGGWENGGRS